MCMDLDEVACWFVFVVFLFFSFDLNLINLLSAFPLADAMVKAVYFSPSGAENLLILNISFRKLFRNTLESRSWSDNIAPSVMGPLSKTLG